MSSVLMDRPETFNFEPTESLNASLLDVLFEGVEREENGEEASRTVIGQVSERQVARIIKKTKLLPSMDSEERQETGHCDFEVSLVSPHDIHEEISIVASSVWNVSPSAALESDPEAVEVPSSRRFAIYFHPENTKTENIFVWYDNQAEMNVPDSATETSPNIYARDGMTKLVNDFDRIIRYGEA
jgi:hypothetical protein